MNAESKARTNQHPFLRNLSPEHLAILMQNAEEKVFAAGEGILKEGEPANRFYLIESGKVSVDSGHPDAKSVQILGPGESLGWSWLFPPFSWHFSARALEPTRCTVLDGAHLLVVAEEFPEFGYDLMRRIAQVLIGRLQATRQKFLEATA